ncbi:phosphotransferase [Microlunatus sp. GCM10028923]|uniref:phosphotransferase n=1 Tax=Microlunatus sp. GCM10028923 TaxID=3273400 RepID=UPI0036091C02
MPDEPDAELRRRVEQALGRPTTSWAVPDTGLSSASRHSVGLADGSRVFVKAATDDDTEHWLRTEHLSLQHVPERFATKIIAWLDGPGRPILVTEDLSRAHWPANHQGVVWRPGDVELLLTAVAELARIEAPDVFPATPRIQARWPGLLSGPERTAFLALQLCSEGWLDDAGPQLVAAEARCDEGGTSLVHGDLRSDNICIDGDRAVFVDWSQTTRGSADHDLAGLLPTLHLEGGALPYDVMPDGAPWAAAGAATLTRRVLHDPLPGWLAAVMTRLVAIDLAWAASSLGLPPPDGTASHS